MDMDTRLYYAFISGMLAAITLFWPVLALLVLGFTRKRPFEAERERIIRNMNEAMGIKNGKR